MCDGPRRRPCLGGTVLAHGARLGASLGAALGWESESLAFPESVVEYFQGAIGQPPGGFPEPLCSRVLKGRTLANGRKAFDGRPGAELE